MSGSLLPALCRQIRILSFYVWILRTIIQTSLMWSTAQEGFAVVVGLPGQEGGAPLWNRITIILRRAAPVRPGRAPMSGLAP